MIVKIVDIIPKNAILEEGVVIRNEKEEIELEVVREVDNNSCMYEVIVNGVTIEGIVTEDLKWEVFSKKFNF